MNLKMGLIWLVDSVAHSVASQFDTKPVKQKTEFTSDVMWYYTWNNIIAYYL